MNKQRIFALTFIAAAALAACASLPASNASLEQARSDYRLAQDTPQVRDLAGGELKQAADSLTQADEALARGDSAEQIDHLAYLSKQRVAIAREVASKKAAELEVKDAGSARDKVRLAARTNQADIAQSNADSALLKSDESQRQAQAAQHDAQDAHARNVILEAQIKELNAKKTERGLVITFDDVLFDTDKAQLKPSGLHEVGKLANFLKQYPQRKVFIEGFTDSVGTESHNQALSERRADAVRAALIDRGVDGTRAQTHGYGEAFPVAGNADAGGRQQNRRVEIVISEEDGQIAPRQ